MERSNSRYQREKRRARNSAIWWQQNFNNENYSYFELYEWQQYFEKLARQYGLIREFKENGII